MAGLGLSLQLPDGSILPVSGVTTLGRGDPPALSDSCLSRHHLLLTPLESQPDVTLLTNQGRNGEQCEGIYTLCRNVCSCNACGMHGEVKGRRVLTTTHSCVS
jgi:hypothetical protein